METTFRHKLGGFCEDFFSVGTVAPDSDTYTLGGYSSWGSGITVIDESGSIQNIEVSDPDGTWKPILSELKKKARSPRTTSYAVEGNLIDLNERLRAAWAKRRQDMKAAEKRADLVELDEYVEMFKDRLGLEFYAQELWMMADAANVQNIDGLVFLIKRFNIESSRP